MSGTAQGGKGGHHGENIPRGVLIAAGVLIVFALAATYYARSTDVGAVRLPTLQAYQTLRLHFTDKDDGGIAVTNADDGALLVTLSPGSNGFLRSMVRGLARARSRGDIGAEPPFTLTRWTNGTMSLIDETTGRRVELDAFGATQAEVFANILRTAKAKAP